MAIRCTKVAVLGHDLVQAMNFCVGLLQVGGRGHSSLKNSSCKMRRSSCIHDAAIWSPLRGMVALRSLLLLFLVLLFEAGNRGTGER